MVFVGGRSQEFFDSVPNKSIEYVTITTDSNASNFGELTVARAPSFGCTGTKTTAYICGGQTGYSGSAINYIRDIESLRYATLANSINFGNIVDSSQINYMVGAHSNQSRAILALAGRIDFIIWNTANISSNFGTRTTNSISGTCGDSVRVIVPACYSSAKDSSLIVQYVPNIYSQAAAVTFGNMYTALSGMASASNGIYALYTGGANFLSSTNLTGFFTIASTGNAVSFGNLNTNLGFHAGSGNSTIAVFGGGALVGSLNDRPTNLIFKALFGTRASYTDFGNLLNGKRIEVGAASGGHGGLM